MNIDFIKEFLKGGGHRRGRNRRLTKVSLQRNQEDIGFRSFGELPYSKVTVVCLYSKVHIFLVNIDFIKDFLKGGGHRRTRCQGGIRGVTTGNLLEINHKVMVDHPGGLGSLLGPDIGYPPPRNQLSTYSNSEYR